MRPYLILTLKWAITLVLSYCIYREGHTYTAIAMIYLMAWGEAYAGLIGRMVIAQQAQTAVIEVLANERLMDDTQAIQDMADILIKEWEKEIKP